MSRYDTFGDALDALFASPQPDDHLCVRREPGGTGWVLEPETAVGADQGPWGWQAERDEREERGL
jgi:hypothetical protein